jgi:hypothetical protein
MAHYCMHAQVTLPNCVQLLPEKSLVSHLLPVLFACMLWCAVVVRVAAL